MHSSTIKIFNDRIDAAQQLAAAPQLQKYKNNPHCIAIALPRYGIPYTYNTIVSLQCNLQIMYIS